MTIDGYFAVSWGRIPLMIGNVTTDNSRSLVVHDLSSGDAHPLMDRGLRARRTRCALLFDDFGDGQTSSNRFRQFKAAVDAGAAAIFTHPIDGSYLANVGEFTYDIDENTVVRNATCEFVAAEEIDAVSPSGAGTNGITGEGAVTQAASDLDTALAAVDGQTDVTQAARDAQASWTDSDTVPTRQVLVDTANLSEQLSTMIEDMGLEDDLALWDVYRASIMFGNAVRAAAIAATSEVPTVFVMLIQRPIAVLVLCARTYGGAEAEDRQRQIEALNDLRTPGWLEPGDQILMPTRSVSQSRSF